MSEQRVIALLGRRNEPTDAVEEYCHYLGQALAARNFKVEIRRVPWDERGWSSSLQALRLQAEAWQGTWILLQYTALAWSARGFPNRFLQVLRVLRKAGARIAVVFHDAEPFGGDRLIDRVRRAVQSHTMRNALHFCDQAILTVPAEKLSWPEARPPHLSFIPVGANLPFPLAPQQHELLHSPPTVGVFSVTGGAAGDRETRDIVAAVHFASQKLGTVRLLVFGRHAETREQALREALRDCQVEIEVCGVVEATDLIQRFAASDVLLFVRGTISSRRGSAIAGIACGLPVIAMQGKETAWPITDAGVILVPQYLDEPTLQLKLGESLVRVFSDHAFRQQLIQRSRAAQEQYFSWPAIAARYAELFNADQ